MFCVGCGEKLNSDWQHCPNCGTAKVTSTGKSTEKAVDPTSVHTTLTEAQAKKALSVTTFAHWLASGKPDVVLEDDEVIGFDLTEKEAATEFVRFAYWFIGSDNFEDWKSEGYPLLDFFFEELEHYELQDGYEILTQAETESIIDPDSLKIWKKAGKPKLAKNANEDWAFADEIGRYRWAMVLEPVTDDDIFGTASDSEESDDRDLTYAEAKDLVDAQTLKALKAAGSPDLVLRNGKVTWKEELTEEQFEKFGLSILSPESGRIWLAAGKPDVNKFIEGLQKQLDELEAEESQDEVYYIESDAEFKQWFGKDNFKGWKKYGRPAAVVINGEHAMLEVQWQFYQYHGYEMTNLMVDGWYFSGCPDIRVWDVEGTMRIYQETVTQMMGMQAQISANNWAGLTQAVSSGFGEITDSLINNANTYSSSRDEQALKYKNALMAKCSRCGQPKPGAICAYCQR